MQKFILFSLLSLFVLAGCAGTDSGNKQPVESRYSIQLGEIKDAHATDAYALIARLRPHWLLTRGTSSIHMRNPGGAIVYLNGSKLGHLESLRRIYVDNLIEVRYYRAGEPGPGLHADLTTPSIGLFTM